MNGNGNYLLLNWRPRAIEPASVEIVERRGSATTLCPHCSGERIVKNRSTSGLQRNLFRGCKRAFNALSLERHPAGSAGQVARPGRASRRHGSGERKPGLSSEQVPVLVARDRSGQTADFVLERDTSEIVAMHLSSILYRDAVLCSDSGTAMIAAAIKLGFTHHAINLAAGVRVDGPWHIQNANSYYSRLKGWPRIFKGVATRYLDSYLG